MRFYISVILILFSGSIVACDFCGCFMGITPNDNQSGFNLLYRYKSYNGYPINGQHHLLFPRSMQSSLMPGSQLKHVTGAGNSYSQKDYEIYSTLELRGKF